ncbi:hypothetical protein BJ742DRAFT_34384 [Cladochytrium replicatum]|nr:hypothetical protein BJ742DRAFT_34384 [Cladochytrium replicatum]
MFRFDFSEDGNNETVGSLDDDPTAQTRAARFPATEITPTAQPSLTLISESIQLPPTPLRIYKRSVADAAFDIAVSDSPELSSSLGTAIASNTDLIPGVYEGGLKTWECAIDLLHVLREEEKVRGGDWMRGLRVLELGCGSGLPGIYCLMHGAEVHFQDYNAEVIHLLTIPNVLLNSTHRPHDDTPTPFETSLDPSSLSAVPARFWSGEWSTFPPVFDSMRQIGGEEALFDLILTSETIYESAYHKPLLAALKSGLKKSGRILIGAKTNYFGCTGTLPLFLNECVSDFEARTVFAKEKTVRREVVELRWK